MANIDFIGSVKSPARFSKKFKWSLTETTAAWDEMDALHSLPQGKDVG